MREIDVQVITDNLKDMCIEAAHFLTDDMKDCLFEAEKKEESPLGKQIRAQLEENLDIAGI